jgi:hypothetical protein
MSIGLYLLPYAEDSDRGARAVDLLYIDLTWACDERDLPERLKSLPSRHVPRHFCCRLGRSETGEHAYREVSEDEYGYPLRWARAADLAQLAQHPQVMASPRNRAAWAYVGALPAGWPVVLFWS